MSMNALEDSDLKNVLQSNLTQQLLASPSDTASAPRNKEDAWITSLSERAQKSFNDASDSTEASLGLTEIGKAALQCFLQANVTGPPLAWQPEKLFYSDNASESPESGANGLRFRLRSYLSVDGETVYNILPHVELFVLSKCLLNLPSLVQSTSHLRWRLRVNTWHQRLLSSVASSLQDQIYRDIKLLETESSAEYLIERASVYALHGQDAKARSDLKSSARIRGFEYALTGRLGKRTKFQQKELSQLVVLAKSNNTNEERKVSNEEPRNVSGSVPVSISLGDDTLLENIAFSSRENPENDVVSEENLPASLATLDAAEQPILDPLDGIILLITASLTTSSSPQDELAREQTIPYADRVIQGGSSNWQIYTQALLVRSRIEGHRSRTAERGVLQLQALVDQVIADTTVSAEGSNTNSDEPSDGGPSTFLSRPKVSESASATERLQYIHQLATPPRWKLESELADRWVSLGALRTALEIYERLQMWAEVALCYAANDREDKAKDIIRQQLYRDEKSSPTEAPSGNGDLVEEKADNVESEPLPADAPRLFCVLGDLEKSASYYERAWEVSDYRYARAQRSLGKLLLASGNFSQAAEAYAQALRVNPQNQATWFALGCIRLQLETWESAAEAFGRAIQTDDKDAESWSNLAVALLKLSDSLDAESAEEEKIKRTQESFMALKHAASLKRDSFRIWQNLLSVAIKIEPPPYADIIVAQSRLIDLLGTTEGEKIVDIPVMEALLADIIKMRSDAKSSETSGNNDSPKVGLKRMVIDLIQKKITPLITSSRRLWLLTAKLSLHLQKPHTALTAYEKAWRAQLNIPGWDAAVGQESKASWQEVAESTIDLIDAYESLGERKREAGMGEGELVAKDWKFKARSAARSVLVRAKDAWEDDEGYERLGERLKELKTI